MNYFFLKFGINGLFCTARTIIHGIAAIIAKLRKIIPTINPKTRIMVHLTGATINQYHRPLRCGVRGRADEPIVSVAIKRGIFTMTILYHERRLNV